MPKEVIRDKATQFNLVVTWSPEEYVQVGVQTNDGRPIVEVLTPTDVEAGIVPTFESVWGTFDRHQINRLILALRRARNSVYGADE